MDNTGSSLVNSDPSVSDGWKIPRYPFMSVVFCKVLPIAFELIFPMCDSSKPLKFMVIIGRVQLTQFKDRHPSRKLIQNNFLTILVWFTF